MKFSFFLEHLIQKQMESLTVVVPGDSVPVLFSVLIPFLQKVYNFQVSAVKGQKEIKVNKGKDIK